MTTRFSTCIPLLVVLGTPACLGGEPSPSPNDASTNTDAALPAAFEGVFHLAGAVDEVNLRLYGDATFRWAIYGCDFCSGGGGRWQLEANAVVLLPPVGQALMGWVALGSFQAPVERVTLQAGPGPGGLTASGTVRWPSGNSEPFQETWPLGRVCAVCGSLGPTGLEPCDAPQPHPASQCPASP